jgi:hypothetical protein
MDLEKFPSSETAQRMLHRVSPIYNSSYVAKWLYQVMGIELDSMHNYFTELRMQAFPQLATWGMRYWEARYGIPVDESIDLKTRRDNIVIRRNVLLSMNPARMEKILKDSFGVTAQIVENYAPYTFQVIMNAEEDSVDYSAISQIINKIKPSHQKYVITLNQPIDCTLYHGALVSEYREERI